MKSLPVLRDEPATALPPLYAAWARSFLDSLPPSEPHATCDACAMLPEAGGDAGEGAIYFDVSTRCCTYAPGVPNFLAGRVLDDPALAGPFGAAVLLARIASRDASPLGFEAPEAARARYLAVSAAGSFGRAPDLRCPHFKPGPTENCGIWRHRNATCSTWFCKHERGGRGALAWRRLRDLFALVEGRLARWCATELGLDDEALARLLLPANHADERQHDPARGSEGWYRAVWGPWLGREREYYSACAARVGALSWGDVAALCGHDVTVGVRLARHALRDDRELPPALKLGDLDVTPPDAEGVCSVRAYSEYDPLSLPKGLVDALAAFDGRPTAQVLAELGANGVTLDEGLVAALVDYEVLVPARDDLAAGDQPRR